MLNIPVINQQLQPAPFPSPSKAILVYASAHWCGPCRQFTPILKAFYEIVKESNAGLEIVFLSSDRSERDMANYYQEAHGGWLAVPFFSPQRQFLSTHFNIRGIPSLILVNRGTMQSVDLDVRSAVQQMAMMRSSDRVRAIVDEWRERSGAMLFDSIPKSMCMLSKVQRAGVFELLGKVIGNVADHPTESKYRQLKGDNAIVKKTILDLPCASSPLAAIGFHPDASGNFTYRPSLADPRTTQLIVSNRDSNGLADLAVSAPVPTIATTNTANTSRDLYVSVKPTVSEASFRVIYRDTPPMETERMAFESIDVLLAITESITDVPSEFQRLFSPGVIKAGPLNGKDPEEVVKTAFSLAATTSEDPIDLLVLGQHTQVNPVPLRTDDARANEEASVLRTKIGILKDRSGVVNFAMSAVYNSAIHAQIYEVPSHQFQALACVPVMDIHNDAIARLSTQLPGSTCYEECVFVRLLSWFKCDFFKWMNKPNCAQCHSQSTSMVSGKAPPTPQEFKGLASVVELYNCEVCGSMTRFPRFNHPVALLTTRTGRCGEWANCFALISRAMGFETRRVNDSADHVWVEVWMDHRREWVHCDPCENAYDQPLLYEQGWGKKATSTVAAGKDGVADVTRRYTADYKGYCDRVRSEGSVLASAESLSALNSLLMAHWAKISGNESSRLKSLTDRAEEEEISLNLLSQTDRRKDGGGLGGRTTGSLEWRQARGEVGNTRPESSRDFFIGNDNDEIHVTTAHGGVHPDTVPFSDEHALRKFTADSGIPRLSKISIWDDGRLVTGVQCEWAEGVGDCHIASGSKGNVPTAALTLAQGEYVSSIQVRVGTHTDYIKLTTSTGRSVAAGNRNGGGEVVDPDFRISEGKQLIGFHGGLGGHIHNMGLLVGPVAVAETPIDPAVRIKEEFANLVAGGMSPTRAAVEVIKLVQKK